MVVLTVCNSIHTLTGTNSQQDYYTAVMILHTFCFRIIWLTKPIQKGFIFCSHYIQYKSVQHGAHSSLVHTVDTDILSSFTDNSQYHRLPQQLQVVSVYDCYDSQ
jgi:hypothetical protein